ncbi:hypothetical protein [Streptomyces sp. NPDC059176]|uniref:hypothetical protein n=1 Tax=Streptomyces sp. NPDC059176 TaxID=3346758 RepID=UPI0036AF78B2
MSAPTPAGPAPQGRGLQPPPSADLPRPCWPAPTAATPASHDPHGLVDAELPLDRAPYEALVTAVQAKPRTTRTGMPYSASQAVNICRRVS